MKRSPIALALALAISIGATAVAPLCAQDRPRVNSRLALSVAINELNADGKPLGQVLDFLRTVSNANIVINWRVLESVGVTKDTAITLQVRDLPMYKILQLVLDQASPNAQLVYGVDSNIISITTQEDADKQMITKIYDVGELVAVPNNIPAPIGGVSGFGGGYGGQGAGYGNSGGAYGNMGSSSYGSSMGTGVGVGSVSSASSLGLNQGAYGNQQMPGYNGQPQKTPDQKGQDLVDLITAVIRPNIWSINGGTATIKYLNGKLIITAPRSVQEAIGGPVGDSRGVIRYGM